MTWNRLTFVVLVTVFAAFACSKQDPKSEARAPDSSSLVPVSDAVTDWIVSGHRMVGVSAMTDAEATLWHGRLLRFEPTVAMSGEIVCNTPSYSHSTVDADSFLASYRVRAVDLALAQPTVRVTRVACDGNSWTAMGGVILWSSPETGFVPWDGVFFEIRAVLPGNTVPVE
jgi:hypothetical protein